MLTNNNDKWLFDIPADNTFNPADSNWIPTFDN